MVTLNPFLHPELLEARKEEDIDDYFVVKEMLDRKDEIQEKVLCVLVPHKDARKTEVLRSSWSRQAYRGWENTRCTMPTTCSTAADRHTLLSGLNIFKYVGERSINAKAGYVLATDFIADMLVIAQNASIEKRKIATITALLARRLML